MELEVDEIKNGIQMSRLRWFGHVMQAREKTIPKKMLQKWRDNDQKEDPEPKRWITLQMI